MKLIEIMKKIFDVLTYPLCAPDAHSYERYLIQLEMQSKNDNE